MLFLLGVICLGAVGNALPILDTLQTNPTTEVTIDQGIVVGTQSGDGNFFEFYGIPYADTTTGSHRFKAPLPPPSFSDIFLANRKDVKCIRPVGNGFEGTEDCLVVDVFTTAPNTNENLSVMVWVDGSEFTRNNENEISFQKLVEKNVVVVSLNYRKSIFGFLCLGTETAPGNAGLKDIIAGLRWVKENIRNFGGNPDDITLFGQGSAAALVDLVTLSPLAEGLIHKAITQSGSALAPWAVSRDNIASAIQVAQALGHTEFTTIEELSEILNRISAPALIADINKFEQTDNSLVFAPCVEREIDVEESFLLKTPYEIISEGSYIQIPIMTGFVDNEGTIKADDIQNSEWTNQMQDSFSDFLQSDLEFNDEIERNDVADRIRTLYFEDSPIPESQQNSIKYFGDIMVLVSVIREARMRMESATAPLYLYQFSYQGSLGKPFVGPIEVESAAHSEELAYIFLETSISTGDNRDTIETIPSEDLAVSDILVERWTNFAKSGVPTSETSSVTWQPFTLENPNYLQFVHNEATETSDATFDASEINPHPEIISFWNEIYEEHFLDAQSNWEITAREDDEITPESTTTMIPPPEDTDTTTPEPDSASTAVGYTFMIIAAFALLDKFHSVIILS